MELLLNIVWFAIASVALGEFARRVSPDRQQFLLALGALGCALLLLFPVVSISDDLHVQTFVAEDSFAAKRLVSNAVHARPVSPSLWFGVSLLAILFVGLRRGTWFRSELPALSYRSPLLQHPGLGRAPPASLLD
jgi:hypothetical protein